MQLLSTLTSTTSPLAMQAMPAVAQPMADFAALLAGMVPGAAVAAAPAPELRQIAALPGKGLPVAVAVTDVATPVLSVTAPDAPTPVLPGSATEAVLMLPTKVEPVVALAVPVVAAAVGTLAKLLPDEDAPPPAPETPAVPVLPTPPRFAVLQPRGRKPESEVPHDRPSDASDDADADTVVPDTVATNVPEVVVLPADVVREDIVLPAPVPLTLPETDTAPPTQTILVDGSVVATDPTTPMRPAKRSARQVADTSTPTPVVPDAVAAGRAKVPAGIAVPADPAARPSAATVMSAAVAARSVVTAPGDMAMAADPPIRPVVAAGAGRVAPVSAMATNRAEPAPAAAVAPAASPPLQPAAPAVGRIVPLPADGVIPVHIVVPPRGDAPLPNGIAAPSPDRLAATDPVATVPVDRSMASLAPALPPTSDRLTVVEAVLPPLAAESPMQQQAPVLAVGTTPAAPVAPSTPTPSVPAPADMAVRLPRSTSVPVPPTYMPVAIDTQAVPERAIGAPRRRIADAIPVEAAIDRVAAGSAIPSIVPTQAVGAAPVSATSATATVRVAASVAAPDTAAAATRPASPLGQPTTAAIPGEAAPAAGPDMAATPPTVAAAPIPGDATAATFRPSVPLPGVTMPAPVEATARPADVRQPIAGEAAAPVVSVAAPAAPIAKPAPVTRIAMPTPSAETVAAPAIVDAAAPAPRARRDEDTPTLPATAAAPDPVVLRPVAAPVQAGAPTLDTRQPQWMEGMIDRIETLRESAGMHGETRIRLSPDALGDVEIAIRTSDDGKVHVHFNSENADAGRLLADAQPRLVQLAEARGLKLGGMQVDVGTQQQSQRQAQDQGNAPPRAPRSATTGAGQPSTTHDDRIA